MQRTRVNPFEIVLWAAAIVLIVGTTIGIVKFVPALYASSSSSSRGSLAVAQTVYVISPGLIGAGFAFAAIALAVRAIDYNARRRMSVVEPVEVPATTEAEPVETRTRTMVEPAETAIPGDQPTIRRATFSRPQSHDNSIFMRPRE